MQTNKKLYKGKSWYYSKMSTTPHIDFYVNKPVPYTANFKAVNSQFSDENL